ncbi:Death-associated protein kinase related [Armadillidium vulgare]|nr:Death-associated protein kinase related [Armadillidium vulgare]
MLSVGVLTYVLLTGFLPFGGESDQETFVEILKGEVDFPPELFEDVTPDAIDFIKKLLIKQPEKRMSAKESLNHSWMTKGRQRRPTPPSTLNLSSSLNSQMSSKPTITVLPSNIFSPAEEQVKAHPVLTKSPSDGSNIIDINLPLKQNGRPPLHPTPSQKSLLGECLSVAGTPVTTPGITLTSPFIYRQESRFGSRHNLDKLRSLSKSREVLSEKVQMSKLKKSMSKSRERLYDSRLGMSKSREKLMSLSSLSQSVEVLSALSHLAQKNLYQSCNNIFVTKPNHPGLSGNPQERMYQSMAAIDQLDNLNSLQKIGYFESRMSLDSEDYNDIITQRNTDMNCFLGGIQFDKPLETKSLGGLRGNSCIGGRGDTCDNRCSRHKQSESSDNQKSTKVNKAEKMKKDAQKKRKEKREKERREHLKKEKEKEKEKKEKERHRNSLNLESETLKQKLTDSPPSPSFRRGSVSHVEQRLQERHERNQERMEREKRNKRRVSADQDRFNSHERFKTKPNSTLQVPNQRSRSNTPTRRKSRKDSPFESDLSQTSSMESVNTSTDRTLTDLKKVADDLNTKNEHLSVDEMNNNVINSEPEISIDTDEAYVSLEDPSLENILMRSKSTESASSEDSEKTVVDSCKEGNSSSSDDEPGIETLSVSEKIFGFEKGIIGVVKKAPPLLKQKSLSDMTEKNLREELPVITEETSPLSSPPTVKRSVSNISNTSDIGSLISESSDYASEKELQSTTTEFQTGHLSPDWKGRSRSLSVYSSPSPPLSSPRSRSNSFNFDVPENSVARPWGNVCSGSVARAFEKFNIKSTDSPKKYSSPVMSPCDETRQQLIA